LTYQDFMDHVQDYFGAYPEKSHVPDYVMAYLKRDIDEERLNVLFRYLSYSHPVNYGAPDIAAIESAVIWGLKNNKGSGVHKSKASDKSPQLVPAALTSEEEAICDGILKDLKKKVRGMSMDARESRLLKHKEDKSAKV
jgi:hypothetical protein